MQLTTCCGCCSLKTGTIIIGLFQFVVAVFMLIVFITWDIKWHLIINLDKMTAKIIFGIYYCILILFCTLLIIGSIKKNAFMMLPWMVINMIIAVIFIVSVFYRSIMFINNDKVSAGLSSFFFGLVGLMLHMYQWLVVYSHFQELRIGSRNCAKERVSIENSMVIDGGPACPLERSDPTSAISFT